MNKLLILGAVAALLGGCQTTLTPTQTAELVCALATDGATVTAIFATAAAAQKAGAVSTVACTAASQVGSIVVTQ